MKSFREIVNTSGKKSPDSASSAGPESFSRLTQADIAWVVEQLAVTQDAGLPLYRSLSLLASMARSDGLRRRLLYMQAQLGEGMSLSQVFAQQEKDWGPLIVALVAAGEASGSLTSAFQRAGELVQARLRLRRKLRTALTYPVVVLVVTALLVLTLLLVVVPRFEEIYQTLGGELPSVTQLVVSLSARVPFVLAGMVLLGVGVYVVLRRSKTDVDLRRKIDRALLRLPVLGKLLEKGAQSRIASTLGILLSSGVPLLEVLAFASDTAGSVPKAEALIDVRRLIADGATFSAALESTGEFPELMVQLVAVGEESGSLPDMMNKYASRMTDEVEAATASITNLVEPMMMVFVGGVVGLFLLALYMPIISLSSEIN